MESIAIKLKNVSIIRDQKYLLKNISFQLNQNENLAIIGRNGSGKSFLLKVLSTNIYPSLGEVEIFGKNTIGMSIWDFRKKIGFVNNDLEYYNRDILVRDVIASGFFSSIGVWEKLEAWQDERINEILDFFDIKNLESRIFKTLSCGEQKKILISRAIVFSPKILILDEPCNGLDLASKVQFLHEIEKLVNSGINLILVSHNIDEILPSIKKIIFLKHGEIYNSGYKENLMNRENLKKVLDIDINVKEKNGFYYSEII